MFKPSPFAPGEKSAFLADEVAAKQGSLADEVVFELGCGRRGGIQAKVLVLMKVPG